jgi:hypothetical protein
VWDRPLQLEVATSGNQFRVIVNVRLTLFAIVAGTHENDTLGLLAVL